MNTVQVDRGLTFSKHKSMVPGPLISFHSNSTELLEVITPEIAVISCSRTNVYGHPSLEAIHRIKKSGAEIYYTMDGGQITIRVQNQKVSVEQYAY